MRLPLVAFVPLMALVASVGCQPHRRLADPPAPPKVPFLPPASVASVTLSDDDICVRLVNGAVLCRRDWRPPEAKTHPASFVPVFESGDVQQVALGGWHGCVRRANGAVQCWGDNEHGEVSGRELTVPWPRVVPISGAVTQVALGDERSCALLIDGHVVCWGTFLGVRREPAQLPVLDNVVELAMSGPAFCLRMKDGWVRCGRGDSSLLAVEGLAAPTQIVAGHDHACAKDVSGTVACWSLRKEDVKGASLKARTIAVDQVVQLASGEAHVCARRLDRSVLCWGENDFGELGDGSRTGRATPAAVARLTDAVDLAAGGRRTCAKRANGALVCWGRNLLDDAMFHALTGLQSPPGPPGDDDSLLPEPLRVPGALQTPAAEG